jgi:hypothetical protein
LEYPQGILPLEDDKTNPFKSSFHHFNPVSQANWLITAELTTLKEFPSKDNQGLVRGQNTSGRYCRMALAVAYLQRP